MYFISTSGPARERGRQHGEQLHDEIREVMESWSRPGPVTETGRAILNWLHEKQTDAYEEMLGIAEGADLEPDQVMRHTIANSLSFLPSACTTFVVRGTDGRCVLGKTQDVGEVEGKFQMINEMTDEDGRKAVVMGMVGTVWALAGMNEDGFAVGCNSAPAIDDVPIHQGLPQHQALYPLLKRESTVLGALRVWLRTPLVGKGINGCLADAVGDAAVFERSGARYSITQASGSVHHTNHFRDAGLLKAAVRPGTENSYNREAFLNRRLSGEVFADPVGVAREILSSTDGDGAVCRALDEKGHGTRSGFLADCASGRCEVADGAPATSEWRVYELR